MTMAACMQSLPKTIKIGAYDWKVVIEDSDEGLIGQAAFEFGAIRLWPANMSGPDKAVGVVLHECLHVIFDNQGLENLKRVKEAREEQIILGFESGLVALLRDNPKLMTWMRRWLK